MNLIQRVATGAALVGTLALGGCDRSSSVEAAPTPDSSRPQNVLADFYGRYLVIGVGKSGDTRERLRRGMKNGSTSYVTINEENLEILGSEGDRIGFSLRATPSGTIYAEGISGGSGGKYERMERRSPEEIEKYFPMGVLIWQADPLTLPDEYRMKMIPRGSSGDKAEVSLLRRISANSQ